MIEPAVNPEGLSEVEFLASLVATGSSKRDCAQKLVVSQTTINRMMREPGFKERVAALRLEMVERVLNQFINGLTDAFAQIHLVATSGENEANKLKASMAICDYAIKFSQHVELHERVGQLEAMLKAKPGA